MQLDNCILQGKNMSYAIITETTKPADTKWFNRVYPGAAKRLAEWLATQPGFVSASSQRIAPNKSRSIVIFETQEHAEAFQAAAAANAEWQAREAFKSARNQVSAATIA